MLRKVLAFVLVCSLGLCVFPKPASALYFATGTLGALNAAVYVYPQDDNAVTIGVTNIGTETIVIEGAIDNATYSGLTIYPLGGGAGGPGQATITANGVYQVPITGLLQVRARVSAYTSGSAAVVMQTSSGSVTSNSSTASPAFTRIQDGSTTTLAAVDLNAVRVNLTANSGAQPLKADGTGVFWVTTGGSANASIPAATALQVVKNSPGRLVQLLVTTAGTASATCYDNASAGSGTIIGITPATTSVGQAFAGAPATAGITCTGGAGSPALTVSYY